MADLTQALNAADIERITLVRCGKGWAVAARNGAWVEYGDPQPTVEAAILLAAARYTAARSTIKRTNLFDDILG